MVNYNEFGSPYEKSRNGDAKKPYSSNSYANRPYRPPQKRQQFIPRSQQYSSDVDRDFVRPGLGFLPADSGQSSFDGGDYEPTKISKYLKPVRFTRSKGQRFLQLGTSDITSTNTTDSSKAAEETAAQKDGDETINTDGDEKPTDTANNEKKPTESKYHQSPNGQNAEDSVIVEDFTHGTYVDENELERLLNRVHVEDHKPDNYNDRSNGKKNRTTLKTSPSSTNDMVKKMDDDDDKGEEEEDISDSELEVQYIYRKELEKRRRKEIRDQKKAEQKAYTYNGYMNGGANYSQYPPQHSQYHHPQSQYPPSPYPPYPSTQYPLSQYSHSPYAPPPQAFTTAYTESPPGQYMSEKEIEKQRRKRLREQFKAEQRAQGGMIPKSQHMNPRDLEEFQKLEKKAERKAQKKQLRDQKRIEESSNPEFVRLMVQVDEQLREFISDTNMTSYEFEPLPTDARRQLHVIAALYGLQSKSSGNANDRRTVVKKTSDTYLPENRQKIERYIFDVQTNVQAQSKIISRNRAKDKPEKEVAANALPLDEDNLGHRMLSAMGWKQGDSLGSGDGGITAPVTAVIRKSRKGLGS